MRNIRAADGLEFCLGGSYEEREFQGLIHRARILLVAQIIAADHVGDFVPLDAYMYWWQECGAGAGAEAGKDQLRSAGCGRGPMLIPSSPAAWPVLGHSCSPSPGPIPTTFRVSRTMPFAPVFSCGPWHLSYGHRQMSVETVTF
ncbi:hypothetical protein E5D57_007520 [Metarhizium anisopliae]|nr:hypothetical protein E5D57_007520 [Metarhizium anisopliae]